VRQRSAPALLREIAVLRSDLRWPS